MKLSMSAARVFLIVGVLMNSPLQGLDRKLISGYSEATVHFFEGQYSGRRNR